MIDMKCPFCQQELVGTIGHPICRNQNCVMCDDPMPQDLLEELIRTRKALDVAVDALKISRNCAIITSVARGLEPKEDEINIAATKALEQITALEQKDVK